MKILHIITRLILGGAQKNTVMTCDAQVRAGCDVHLAFGPIYGPEGSLRDDAEAAGVTLHEITSMRRAVLPVHDVLCYRALRKLIGDIKPDVVHTHSSKAGIVGRAAAWAEDVPAVIHTVHGLPFHERQPRWLYRAYVTAERYAAKRCHALIGITEAMRDAFAAENIAPPEKFTIIPSGIDLDAFEPHVGDRTVTRRAYGIDEAAPVIGIVARLDPLKGHDDLLDVLPQLIEVDSAVRYLFVGDGWHRQTLERRVAEAGWDDRVIFAGLVPPKQVPSLLHAMDVMALPSYQEGQGRTLVEALLCGCAIVGYNAGGIGEICIDQKTGRLVPIGDRTALGAALRDLIANHDERRRLADAGRAFVRERYDVRNMTAAIAVMYEEIMNHRGHRGHRGGRG